MTQVPVGAFKVPVVRLVESGRWSAHVGARARHARGWPSARRRHRRTRRPGTHLHQISGRRHPTSEGSTELASSSRGTRW
jgi:hypothetical protein